MDNTALGGWVLNGLLIMIVVVAALVFLWFIMAVLSKIMQKVEKTGASPKQGAEDNVKNPRLTRLYAALVICIIAVAVLAPVGISLLTK